jgi:hypothetical protein
MFRTRGFLLAVATGLAFSFLLSSCALTSNLSGSLVGTVRDADTGQTIPYASVECAGLFTQADSNGEYSLEGIEPGDRVVYASASGYVNYSRVVHIDGVTGHDISMEPYVPSARMFGYVSHATFGPLEGATVNLGDLTTTTDATGYYEFPNVLQTTYAMSVSKDGYRTLSRNVTPNAEDYRFDVALKYLASATLPVIADATVFSETPDANSGSSSLLQLFANGILTETCFVLIDTTGVEDTAEPILATLWLYHTEAMGTEADRTMMVARVLGPWSEGTITWQNAPSTSGASSVSSTYEDNWFAANVTSYFSEWLNGGASNYGLYLDTAVNHDAGRFYFASREYFDSDVHPYVLLDYAW